MKLLNGTYKIRNRIMAAFLAVTMLLTLVPTGQMQVYAAGEGKVNVDSFTVKVNGVPLENVTEIKEGDKVLILCNWSLDDSDKTVDTYKVDLSPMLSNLKLVAGTPATVYDSELGAVGTVTIDENGVATYVFTNDKFLESTSRTGSSTYDGVVTSTDKKNDNGKDVPFGIGTTKKTVKYYADQKTSELNVQKSRPSSAVMENGKLYQTFEVTLSAKDGIVKGITLEDIAGSGLTNLSELKIKTVNGSDVGVTVGTAYSDMAQLNAALQGAVLAAGESITISYKMEVDPSIYTETSNIGKFGNIIKANYKDNRDNDKEKESNLEYADAKGPEMSKTATDYDETTGVITWKVTIRLNDYLEDFQKSGKSIENYITDIVETPGTGLNQAVKLTGITEESEGVYSIVYTTSVTDEYKRRLENGSYTFKNTITAKVNGTDVKASADKTVNADKWIEKTCIGFDDTTRTLTWDVTLNIPNDVTDVVIRDYVQDADRHVLQPTVTYAGTTIVNSGTIVDSSIVKSWESAWQGYSMALTDAFVSSHAGQLITFTYTSVIPDGYVWNNQTEFTNKAHLSYKDAVLGNQNQEVEATWKDVNKQGIVLTKKAIADNDKDSIAYEVKVDLSEMASLAAGDTVTITDVLPDIMKFDGNATAKLVYIHQYWEDSNPGSVSVTVSDVTGANAKDFSFTVTEQMVNAVADGKTATDWYKPTVIISYTASIADERSFVSAGKKESITNTVTGKKGETSLGTASATAELTPKTVVKKTATYTADSAPDIEYEIEINPNALTLSTNGKLTGEDHLGTALTYNDDIKITEVSTGTVLTRGTDYTVSISSDKKKMIVVVPDGKHLKLTYTAKLNLRTYADETKNEYLTDENSYNEFSLSGFSSDQTKDRKSYNQVAYTPKHQTVSETGSVTIKKFWTNNGTYTALAGSEFKIVQVSYDAATGKMVDGTVIKDNIVVGVDGTIKVENLRKDRIYALYETKAKEGFARRTDPYYFIIDDDNSVTLPSGVIIEKFVEEENELEYENRLEAVLYITKTVENEDWDTVKNDITFTVKKGDLVIATVNGADMTENGGVYVATINQLEAGEYTVTETIAAGGKTPKTVTYKVGVTAAKTGQEATGIILLADSYNTVAFTNTYEVKKGSLEITKTVTGDRNWEQVKNTMTFKVTDESGVEITGSPVAGTAFTETTPGSGIYHYVFNGLTAGKTYTVTEVLTGEDAAYARTTTYTGAAGGTGETAVSAPISNTANTVVAFTNAYTAKTGEIEVTKKFGGSELPSNFETVTLTVENEAGTVVGSKTLAEIRSAAAAGTEGYAVTGSGAGAVYTWTLKDLPYGKYKVTETVTAANGYQCTARYQINATAEKNYDGTVKPEVTVGAATQKVAFTNTYTKLQGSLEITKTVTGDRNWEQVKNTMTFKVTDESGVEITGSPVAGTAFTETTPGSGIYHYVFNGLTAGKTYTVTEVLTGEDAAYARTTTYTAAASGTGETAVSAPISNAANVVVAFTNTYTKLQGSLEITKTVTGDRNWEQVKNTMSFKVTDETGAEITGSPVAGTAFTETTPGSGIYHYVFNGLTAGKTYTVTEVLTGEDTAYTRTTTYTAQTSGTGETAVSAPISNTANTVVAFTNAYTAKTGEIEVTKKFGGSELPSNFETVTLTVENEAGTVVGSKTLAEIRSAAAAGTEGYAVTGSGAGAVYTWTLKDLPYGKYKVTETVTAANGYQCTAKYQINATAEKNYDGTVKPEVTVGAATQKVAFTNTYTKLQGSLEITKTVTGDRNWEQVKNTMSFKVTDETGVEITGSPVAGTAFTETTPGSGIYHYVFNGLTAGKTYTVTEALTGEDVAYARTTTYTAAASGTGETAVSAPISNTANTVVAFTNAYTAKTGEIEVTKKFGGSELPSNFETVTLTVENEAGTVVGSKTLAEIRSAAAAGTEGYAVTGSGAGAVYTWTLKDLPYGKYKVTETVTAATGYQCTAKYQINATAEKDYDSTAKPEVTVGDATQKVSFTNTYTKLQGGLEIIKRVHGDLNWEQVKNTISFKITNEDGNEIPGSPVAGTAFTETTPGSGIYYYEINGLIVGKAYTVTEVLTGEDEAYSRTTTYVAATRGTGETAVSVPVQDSMYSVVTFDNTYTKKTGKLVITKSVAGNVDKAKAEAAISFKVTKNADGTSKTYKLSDFTYDTAGKIWKLELDTVPGGYQVEETRNAVGGFTLKKVQYEVDASGKVDGSSVQVQVNDGASTKVAFENTYVKKTTTPSNPTTPPVTPTTPPSPQPPEPTPADPGTPGTGDNSNLAIWFILFAISGMGLAALAISDKKNKKKQ